MFKKLLIGKLNAWFMLCKKQLPMYLNRCFVILVCYIPDQMH